MDYRVLPANYGMGSSTLNSWIASKMKADGLEVVYLTEAGSKASARREIEPQN